MIVGPTSAPPSLSLDRYLSPPEPEDDSFEEFGPEPLAWFAGELWFNDDGAYGPQCVARTKKKSRCRNSIEQAMDGPTGWLRVPQGALYVVLPSFDSPEHLQRWQDQHCVVHDLLETVDHDSPGWQRVDPTTPRGNELILHHVGGFIPHGQEPNAPTPHELIISSPTSNDQTPAGDRQNQRQTEVARTLERIAALMKAQESEQERLRILSAPTWPAPPRRV